MQRLILLRHGEAESVSAAGGDSERGLTERGRRDAALMSRVLGDLGMKADVVLVSSARRTRETWRARSAAFPAARVEIDPALYLAEVETLTQAIDANETAAHLMIIGHNPGLHELAMDLARQSPAPARARLAGTFPTAAAAIFNPNPDGSWMLEQLVLAHEHGGGWR